MQKETDLLRVKNTLIAFLNMPIEETEMSPIVVQHPVFESGFSTIDGKIVNIMEQQNFEKAVLKIEEKIITRKNVSQCLFIVRKTYYLTFLKYIKTYLSLSDFSEILGRCWTEEENPNCDVNVSTKLAARWFRQADKRILMYDDEYEIYSNLPESFTVYRGVTPGHNPDGMSWTREYDQAEWFSNRFGDGYILEGIASKGDVLAFFNRRGEEEIVIEARDVKNKKKI